MTAEGVPPPGDDAEEPVPTGSPAGRLLLQFFVIPFFVVAVAVGVFWLFGAIAVDRKGAKELLTDVKTGSRNQRWQSAFELTRKLPTLKDPAARASFAAEAVKVFEGAGSDDPRVRRYLTLVLGRLGDPAAVPTLEKALDGEDAETRLYALWALAMIGHPGSAPKIRPLLASEDAGVRKTAAYAMGRMEDSESIPALRTLLGDPVVDVRWNAALALATLDDDAGRSLLTAMTDRAQLSSVAGVVADQQDEAMLNGLKGLVLLKDPSAKAIGEKLLASDSSLRVRREVPEILKGLTAR